MATSNLSELTNNLREINSPVTVNVIAEPEKEVINTIKKGDSDIIKSLMAISQILMEQLSFDKDVENRRKLEEHLKPKDFQEQSLTTTATREDGAGGEGGGGGILETYGLMRLFGDGLKGLFGLFKRLGGFLTEILGLNTLFTALKDGLGSIIGKVLELGRVFGPLALRFGALSTVILGIGEAFKALEKIIENTDWYKKYSEWAGPKLMEGARSIGNAFDGMFQTPGSPETRTGRTIGDPAKPGGGGTIRTWDDVDYGTGKKKFQFNPEVASILKQTAEKTGIDENYLRTMAHIESRGDPRAQHGKYGKGAAGLFQFIPETAKKYGIRGKEYDPRASAEAAAKLTLDNKKALEKAGIEATPEMLYIAHQQGAQGAINLVKYAKEGKTFAELPRELRRNITSNVPGRKALGAEEFLDFWKKSYREHAAVAGLPSQSPKNGMTATPTTKTYDTPDLQKTKEILSSRLSHKGVDIKNLSADYASNLSAFIKDAEKEFGKKIKITSAYRPPTGKEKEELGSVGSTQGGLKKGKRVGSTYGSMHGMGIASDVMFEGMGMEEMNAMSASDKKRWLDLAQKHNLDIPMRPGGTAPSVTEWWHVEPKGAERGGAKRRGLYGKEYTDYIRKASLEENIKNKATYAKVDEKQLPEGGKYKEEESEMEEMDESILSENDLLDRKPITVNGKTYNPNDKEYDEVRKEYGAKAREMIYGKSSSTDKALKEETSNSKLVSGEFDLDKQVDSGYKGFFEDMMKHLEKMVSFTENIKETNKQMADAETAKKESDSSKQTASKEDEEAEKTMDDLFGPEEPKITQIPNQNNPFGGGVFGNTPGTFGQNPFGTIQGVLGTIGSTVSMGQQIGNMGKYGMGGGMMGGIYGAQGAIGGIQGVLGQMGQQSPALGGLGQVLGSVGSVAGSIEGIKNMGKYGMGGGGILGGISAASGVVGAAGNIYNAIGGLGQVLGSVGSVAGSIEGIKNMGKYGAQGAIGGIQGVLGQMGQQSPALGGLGQVLGGIGGNSTPEKGGKGFFEGIGDSIGNLFGGNEEKPSISSLGVGEDSASLSKSLMNDGMMLESTTQSVQAGKEEMMTPTSSEPTIVNAGGGSGGGGSGGGGNSQSNPSSAGVMGIDIGVRNEEATLLRAQFGSVRIV